MKVIFVDIDGPLATDESSKMREKTKWHPNLYKMDVKCVSILNEIIEDTGCELVVSSDWRIHFSLEELGEIFEWNNVIKKPIGVTSQECISMSDSAKNRIYQIKLFLDEIKPEMWAVIDDLPLGINNYKFGLTNYVYCDEIEGLAEKNKKQEVIDFLIKRL